MRENAERLTTGRSGVTIAAASLSGLPELLE